MSAAYWPPSPYLFVCGVVCVAIWCGGARRAKPLALYVMGENTSDAMKIVENTTAGGITINDTAVHYGGSI